MLPLGLADDGGVHFRSARREQNPRTLLLMRVVEIGLPLLLSLISLFFVFRYPLTDARSYEIKEALEKRNNG